MVAFLFRIFEDILKSDLKLGVDIMVDLYDVIIIGGGVVGSAIARELSKNRLKIGVLEKNLDVCYETSGRNSAVVHGGFAYDVDSLKAKLCVQGNKEFEQLSQELNFPFLKCGKVLVGSTQEDRETLMAVIRQGEANSVEGLELISNERLHELVPKVVGEFAMLSPNSGITDPFQFTIALAENACQNGVKYHFDNEVTAVQRNSEHIYEITTSQNIFYSRWVVNSAGLGCGKISDMLGITGYKVIGSKGNYIILDKNTGKDLSMPVYPVPSNTYMGIHVTNTIDGNVIVGPDANAVMNFDYYGVPQKNMDYLAESASELWPCIHKADYIRNYSGILPKWVDDDGVIQDFKIEILDDIAPYAVNLVGIESPGLTAAVPIAKYVEELMRQREAFEPNEHFNPIREKKVRFSELSSQEKEELIQQNPDYGEIVCRCEKVTKAEIIEAIHNPLGVSTVVGIKYRTRSMMGRCQGGYCQMRLTKMIQEELGISKKDVVYARTGSNLFTGCVRGED